MAANKGYAVELRPLMLQESQAFLDDLMFNGDGRLQTLLRAGYTFVNERLAGFYNLGAGLKGTAMQKVALDPTKRAGILTQGGVMAVHAKADQSSPILRGRFVRERFFCQSPPPPPNDVDATPPKVMPGATTRERFAQHTINPTCAACHRLMDPLGFGLENFDAVGRWRDTDQGRPVDATGEIAATDDSNGAFNGAGELTARLARSEQVGRCVATQWFRHGYGRAETDADACTLALLNTALRASGGDMRQLILALTRTDAFLYRNLNGGAP